MAGLNRFRWWHWIPWPWTSWRAVLFVDAGDQIPITLPRKAAVIVGPPDRPTWVAFDCPCDRRHRVMLNLDQARKPRWTLAALRPLSIEPSIDDRTPQRRCHFFLRRGKPHWVNDDGGTKT